MNLKSTTHSAIVTFFLLFVTEPLPAPTIVGTGGDVVMCTATPDNQQDGYFLLDYLLACNISVMWPRDWQLDQIGATIYYNVPALYQDYKTFTDSLFSNDPTSSYRWISETGLPDIPDEDFHRTDNGIADNCRNGAGQINKFQAVIRQVTTDHVLFRYDETLIDAMRVQRHDEQLTYLLLHEFFWSYAKSSRDIRKIIRHLLFEARRPEVLQSWLIGSLKVNTDPTFAGDTRSLRLYMKDGQVVPEQSMTVDIEHQWHQLIIFNDLPSTMLVYRVGQAEPVLSVEPQASGRYVFSHLDGREFTLDARSRDGALRSTMRIATADYGPADR